MVLGQAFLLAGMSTIVNAQPGRDSLLQDATLGACVQYALQQQPLLQQTLIDEQITERTIKGKLADWYPQVNLDYSLQHNFQLQTSVFQGVPTHIGVNNTSGVDFSLKQTIFDRDVLLASRTARDVRMQVRQNTLHTRIDVVLAVSKAFYDVLLTRQQVRLVEDDIVRLSRSLQDAYNQYQAGIVDKTDYKRAQVALNNSGLQKKQYEEQLAARMAYLKEQMGYPDAAPLNLLYDSARLEKEIYIDTLQPVTYTNRIEYQQLQTQKRLLQYNLRYYKWSYLPSLSAFGQYNLNFFNNEFSKLYDRNYPNSYAGLTLSFPIFQGTKRVQEVRTAELQLRRLDYDFASLGHSIHAEYAAALAAYKASLADYVTMKQNLDLAADVYNTIQLQYKAGVKTYLDAIIAETDLRTTQVNLLNALYQTLSSKLDVEKALGTLPYSVK